MDYNKVSLAKNGQVTTQIKPSIIKPGDWSMQAVSPSKQPVYVAPKSPSRLPVLGSIGGIIKGVNPAVISRQPTDNSMQRLGNVAGDIVFPNPINPFVNPSGAIQKQPGGITFPFLFNNPMTVSPDGKGGALVTQEDFSNDVLSPIRDEIYGQFEIHGVDLITGIIGIVIVLIGVYQIAKPI